MVFIELDMSNMESRLADMPELEGSIAHDLRFRLPKIVHPNRPPGATTARITLRPGIYMDSINYDVQYGSGRGEEFVPVGDVTHLPGEALPFAETPVKMGPPNIYRSSSLHLRLVSP